jgi:hypothetical protein
LTADQTSAKDKTARQVVDQSLWAFEEAKAALAHDLQSAQASLTATIEKLISKSSMLDLVLIRGCEAKIKLQTAKEKIKAHEQSLASTQKVLSKREFSSSVVIFSAVANAMAPLKNHMPELDTKILQKDFTVDDAGQEALVESIYDTTQHFLSLYDFSVLPESDNNASPGAL